MPSTYTTNNGIELIGDGEQSGLWGDTTNTNFTLIDTSLDGHATVTLVSAGTSGSPNALPITDGAASNGRNRALIFTDGGDLGADVYVRLTPNDAKKILFVRNSLSGSRNLVLFQGTYNASNDFVLAAGKDAIVKFDGGGTGAIASALLADLALDAATFAAVDINGGTIDGATIGGASAAAGSFTTVSATGNITVGGTVDGRDVAADGTKLDTIETNADVTDTANVTAAGALMDSELTNIAAVKALDQGVATSNSPSFVGVAVSGTGDKGITVTSTNAGDSRLDLLRTSANSYRLTNDGGDFKIQHGSSPASVDTNTRLTIINTGEVGIGTTTPSEKLDVNGNLKVTGNIDLTGDIELLGGQIFFNSTGTSGDYLNYATQEGLTFYENGIAAWRLSGAAAEDSFINSGNVGIGTTTPSEKLDVVGNVELNGNLRFNGGFRSINQSTATDLGLQILGATSNTDGANIAVYGKDHATLAGDVYITSGGATGVGETTFRRRTDSAFITSMVIDSSGNVGVGTSSPSTKLDVNGSASIGGILTVSGDTTLGGNLTVSGFGATTTLNGVLNVLGDLTAGSNIIPTADNTGNVGTLARTWNNGRFTNFTVDSTLTSANVTVSGTLTSANAIINGALNVSDYIYHYADADTYMRFPAANTWQLVTGGNTSLYSNSSGNVGIGTTAPSAKLHVNGTLLAGGDTTVGGNLTLSGFSSFATFNGTVRASEYIEHVGDSNTYMGFNANDQWRVATGGNITIQSVGANVGIGEVSPASRLHVTSGGGTTLTLEATNTNTSGGIDFYGRDGTATRYKAGNINSAGASGSLELSADPDNAEASSSINFFIDGAEVGRFNNSGDFRPGTDNTQTLGVASYRWSVVYAGTGTINTSDEREKEQITDLDAAELAVAVAAKGLIKKFKMKNAVELKGDGARWHFGVIAQELVAAFEAQGLDPWEYGVMCKDTWVEADVAIPAEFKDQEIAPAEHDAEGNETAPAVMQTVEVRAARVERQTFSSLDDVPEDATNVEEHERMGVRYDELFAFILAAM